MVCVCQGAFLRYGLSPFSFWDSIFYFPMGLPKMFFHPVQTKTMNTFGSSSGNFWEISTAKISFQETEQYRYSACSPYFPHVLCAFTRPGWSQSGEGMMNSSWSPQEVEQQRKTPCLPYAGDPGLLEWAGNSLICFVSLLWEWSAKSRRTKPLSWSSPHQAVSGLVKRWRAVSSCSFLQETLLSRSINLELNDHLYASSFLPGELVILPKEM